MKKLVSIILTLSMVFGCYYMIPTAAVVQAETTTEDTEEEWTELGTNDGLSWATCSADLESQTITFSNSVKVKKLRLYVTGTFGSNYIIRELEILDKNGKNAASDKRWSTNVTVTTNMTNVNTDQLSYLCNGNGGENGFDNAGNDPNWDKFEGKADETGYVEFTFQSAVEVAAVRIWCTWCNNSSWGNAPKSWKITGMKEIIKDAAGFELLGDNSQSAAWADTPSNTFEYQEIKLDTPVWLDKIRLKVTDVYSSSNTYRITEFEVFNTDGVNVLASVLTDYKCDTEKGQYGIHEDGYKRSSLATVTYAEGMPEAKADSNTQMPGVRTGDMIINGENMSNTTHWYDRTNASANLENDYIEFVFDRPYEIASARLWSNWCNGTSQWGCAPKSWQIWGSKTQQRIEDTLDTSANWSDITGFTIVDGKAIPTADTVGRMYAGNSAMKEYRAEAELLVNSGQMGVYTHVAGDSYYLAVIDKANDKILLYKGSEQVAEKYWPVDGAVKLAVTVNGSKVSVWVDEVKMMDYIDETPLVAGRYGLYAGNADGYFESVTITPIDIADTLPADYPYEPTAEAITEELTEGDFYVAENGSDVDNDGKSLDRPFATIQKAQEAVKAARKENPNRDYVVILRGGTYYLDSTLKMNAEDGGSGLYRVTYAAYKGETPILSGGRKVDSEWTACTDADKQGIYVTTLPEEFKEIDIRQLFVNDTRATRSREPDIGETDNEVNENGYWYLGAVADDYTWVSPKGTLPESWAELSDAGVEMCHRVNWEYHRQLVTAFDTTNNRVTVKNGTTDIVGKRDPSHIHPSVSLKDWMYFENALEFVDTPNEWYYDKDTNQLYYYPEEGTDPNDLYMVIPFLDRLLDITGTEEAAVKNIDFLGLQFCHTTWYMPEEGSRIGSQGGRYLIYDSDSATTGSTIVPEAAVNLHYTEGINIQDCNFTMMGEGALKVAQGAHSNRIDGNTFTDVGGYGIVIGHSDQQASWESSEYDNVEVPRGNVILNNYMNYCGTVDKSCLGIWGTYLNHTQIKGNTVKNMTYTGISVGWKWTSVLYSSHHNEIVSNAVTNVMMQLHDGAGIYVLGSQYNSKMNDNYVKDTAGVNIYFDEGTRFFHCDGNYMSDIDIFYHMCSKDEMLANENYVKTNHVGATPDNPEDYGCPTGENGDANYDGAVDVRDVVRLKRYLDSRELRIDRIVSDITGDGAVNRKDLTGLKRLLVEPKVVPETSYAGKKDYTQPGNDYVTTANLVSVTGSVALKDATPICDNNYSSAYDSNATVMPEEFVFRFDKAIETETTLRIVANYASKQGPSKVELYVQKGAEEWVQIKNCSLNWDTTIDDGQCVEIPLKTTGITGLKLVVTAANLTWNHYIISELDLFDSAK